MTQLSTDRADSGYRNRPVLSSVSLAVRHGELLAIIGPNGAGKTTLLKVLARQLRLTAGAVLLDDTNLWAQDAGWVAQRIALAPQGGTWDRPLTVNEAVALGRAPHCGWILPLRAIDREAVLRSLRRVGLIELAERPVTELSAGEAQRVVLARALAQSAEVLLVDEPTSHLDIRYQCEILDLLKGLTRENVSVVVVLHDLNLAGLWADRVALLASGQVLAVGKPEDVLTAERLNTAYKAKLVVTRHPVFGTPLVSPVPGARLHETEPSLRLGQQTETKGHGNN
jgi:iron complex transport system ATP-binding protein